MALFHLWAQNRKSFCLFVRIISINTLNKKFNSHSAYLIHYHIIIFCIFINIKSHPLSRILLDEGLASERPFENGHPAGQSHLKKPKEKKNKKKLWKRANKKKAFPYESSLGEIRLMTRPCIRSRHVTVQMSFGQARQTHKFKKLCFTWLKCIEIISLFW